MNVILTGLACELCICTDLFQHVVTVNLIHVTNILDHITQSVTCLRLRPHQEYMYKSVPVSVYLGTFIT